MTKICRAILKFFLASYGRGLVTHNVNAAAVVATSAQVLPVATFRTSLMADGTPVYTHGTYADGDGYYMGDKTIADVRTNRDSRLSVFPQGALTEEHPL